MKYIAVSGQAEYLKKDIYKVLEPFQPSGKKEKTFLHHHDCRRRIVCRVVKHHSLKKTTISDPVIAGAPNEKCNCVFISITSTGKAAQLYLHAVLLGRE